jgi:hypothetical protein
MSSPAPSKNSFFIRFGDITTVLIEFDDNISFDEVQKHMFAQLRHILPNVYHMEFYSRKTTQFLAFDETVLGSEYNPFLTNNDQTNKSVTDIVELFIVDDSNRTSSVILPNCMYCFFKLTEQKIHILSILRRYSIQWYIS